MLNESSDRRVNVNRYYMYAMSFLVLALSTFFLNKGGIINIGADTSSTNEISPLFKTLALCGISFLGAAITESWIQNASGYLLSNSKREEIIRRLEVKIDLSINFYEQMRIINDNKDYKQLAYHELYAPLIFRNGFLIIVLIGTFYLKDIYGSLSIVLIIALIILLLKSCYTKIPLSERQDKDDDYLIIALIILLLKSCYTKIPLSERQDKDDD